MSAQTIYPRFGTGSVPSVADKWADARTHSSATVDAEEIGDRFGRAHSLGSASLPAGLVARFRVQTSRRKARRPADPRIAACPAASGGWASKIKRWVVGEGRTR